MTKQLKSKMVQRGYKARDIQRTIRTVPFKHRKKFLNKPKKQKTSQPPLVFKTRFTDYTRKVSKIMKKHWPLISSDPLLNQIFPTPPMIAHTNNPSLRNKLVKSRLTDLAEDEDRPDICSLENPIINDQTTNRPNTRANKHRTIQAEREHHERICKQLFHQRIISVPCNTPNCILCRKLIATNFVKSKTFGNTHHIKYDGRILNCKSSKVVYLIQCDNARNNTSDRQYNPSKSVSADTWTK